MHMSKVTRRRGGESVAGGGESLTMLTVDSIATSAHNMAPFVSRCGSWDTVISDLHRRHAHCRLVTMDGLHVAHNPRTQAVILDNRVQSTASPAKGRRRKTVKKPCSSRLPMRRGRIPAASPAGFRHHTTPRNFKDTGVCEREAAADVPCADGP
ncbi:hypothetical protein LY78DRAFT_280351 [Colletotrichum sublineola]|nr:hypothetical protein LY78DRAFT_280351 [Colletotrichum sublineola]